MTKVIALYLPQFHPIPENDQWWGKGFTEWTNVTRARPLFGGHYQPHLPADLGFCDLRLPQTREAQAELAREHGIHGFCYYHYWFNGRRILERPFNEVLASGKPDFPFCLCWANENWTRAWNGLENDVLLQQVYSPEDDIQHIRSLFPAFGDERYIRINGRPLFLVYRANRLPDPRATTQRWRDEARRAGMGELFLCRIESFPEENGDPRDLGFDAALEFQPRWFNLGPSLQSHTLWKIARRLRAANRAYARHRIFDYSTCAREAMQRQIPQYPLIRTVCPSWDNSARKKGGAMILRNSTPEQYGAWLRQTIATAKPIADEKIVFVNAWNEWAEGNYLEPCQRWGRQYLQATRDALLVPCPGTPGEG